MSDLFSRPSLRPLHSTVISAVSTAVGGFRKALAALAPDDQLNALLLEAAMNAKTQISTRYLTDEEITFLEEEGYKVTASLDTGETIYTILWD